MSFLGPNTATLAQIAANTVSTTLFSAATNVSGRSFYNSSTAACFLAYGTVATTSAYTTQVAATTTYTFPAPAYSGQVTGIWAAANGTVYTTQW